MRKILEALQLLDTEPFWNSCNSQGSLARVALLDTGIDKSHIRFNDCKVTVKDFCNSAGKGVDVDGHGTHCSGAILDIAPKCMLLAGRVLTNSGLFSYDALTEGLQWAIQESADIVCITYGEKYIDLDFAKELEKVLNQNRTLVVTSVGNEGKGGVDAGRYPGLCKGVIPAGSITDAGELSDFTDLPPMVEVICVPGENYTGAWPSGLQRTFSGTSIAASRLSALLALHISFLKKRGKEIIAREIKEQMIKASTRKESSRGPYLVLDPRKLLSQDL